MFGPKNVQHHLEVNQEGFLVKAGGLETEGVDDVVDLRSTLLESFICLLGRRVRACTIG